MRSLAPSLHSVGNRGVRYRIRKGEVTEITGATCVVTVAGGPIGGVVPYKGYAPKIGDIAILERIGVVNYTPGAITPP